jgi:hypothetical protein
VLVTLTALVALLALLFLGGGGNYYAGEIEAAALTVQPSTDEENLTAVEATRGSITLAVDEAGQWRDELGSGGVFGIQAGTSYGQVFGSTTGPGPRITRDFRLLRGRLPEPGSSVGYSRRAFPDPRAAVGRPFRTVTVTTELGPQPAWFVPGVSSTWAILVHGKGEDRREMLRMMRSTAAAGLPSLDITYRNDAEGPQDPSGDYQYGRTEWRDLDAAVAFATAHGAKQVALVGASMGGAVIASYLRNTPSHAGVAAVALDAPMLDLGETVSYGARQRSLPLFGHVPGALTWAAKRIAAVRYGVDWGDVDYADDSSWLDVPTLVFHGTSDRTVPVGLSRRVAAAHPDGVTLVTVPGAGHVASWNADPRTYDATLTRFLREQTTS